MLWKRNYRCSSLNGLTKLLALEEGDHFVPWEEWAIPSGWGIRHISCTADQVSRLHHGKHLPKPASKISSLSFNGPKPSCKAMTTSLLSQRTAWPSIQCLSYILWSLLGGYCYPNPGCTGPSTALVGQLPALAFAILQKAWSPPGFKMFLEETT